jgi:uncharacterized protein (DUF58 family)
LARSRLNVVPRAPLLAAIVVGAALFALALLGPVGWLVVLGYNLVLLWLALLDALTLPAPGAISVRREMPRPLSLGAEQEVALTVAVAGRGAGLRLQVADHAPAALRASARSLDADLDGGGAARVGYRVHPPRRGAFVFGPTDVRLHRRGGLVARQARVGGGAEVAVYPDVLAVRQYELRLRRGLANFSGGRRARVPGATTELSAIRDYLPGDEVRRINWKASARRDRPVVNEVEAERGQQMILMVDSGRLMTAPAGHARGPHGSPDPGGGLSKLDHAVNSALLLAWVAQAHGDRVGLMTFSDRVHQFVTPRAGRAQIAALNEVLYRVQPEYTEPDFGEAMGQLARRVSRRSLVVVLTDLLDPDASRDLVAACLRASARHLVLVVAMNDPVLAAARLAPVDGPARAYEWAAAEELLAARRQSFEILHRGGVLGLDVAAGQLSAALVERYLALKERALL